MALVLQILSLIVILGHAAPLWARDARNSQAKSEALSYLQNMRERNVTRLKEIDETLRIRIEDSAPATLEFEINRLKVAKLEHSMRQEFLNRLIFQVDTKFGGGDLRLFLERALNEMAKTDATQMNAQADGGLWKFMKFASDAVRRLPEKKENILAFLEGYMNRSVANPIRPEDYLNTRNYSNGLASETGNPLEREEVGALADRRIRELKGEPLNEAPPKAMSQMAPVAAPPANEPAAAGPAAPGAETAPAPTVN